MQSAIELYEYSLVTRKNVTSDISILRFAPTSHKKIKFKPGQYTQVNLDKDTKLLLSIANTPEVNGEIEFHIRSRKEDILVARFLDIINNKETIFLSNGMGHATVDNSFIGDKKIIFVAGGTGFSQIKSLLVEITRLKIINPIHLYWGIRTPIDYYQSDFIDDLLNNNSNINFIRVISEPYIKNAKNQMRATDKLGLVTEIICKDFSNMENSIVYISGPYPMVVDGLKRFTQKGLEQNNFLSDMVNTRVNTKKNN